MISLPARSLYLVCDSVASKFFTVGRVTHIRGGASAEARRERDQEPAPSINGIALGARS